MSKEPKDIKLSEQIFEIRYKANPKILDHRGTWAELISSHLELPHWQIMDNRIDVHDKSKSETFFVGFRNTGFTCYDAATANYFPDKALKFLKYLFSLEGFGNPLYVERLGVRSRFVTSFPSEFDDLRDRFVLRYLSPTAKAAEIIHARLVDIGGPLNFVDELGNFNTVSGPMIKDQISQYVGRTAEYPEVGFYFDIDYWTKPNKEVRSEEALRLVKAYATEGWRRHDDIRRLICED